MRCCGRLHTRTIDLGGPLGALRRLHRSCVKKSTCMESAEHRAFMQTAEHRAFMKAAWRLVPFVTIGYLLNYMDRNNVGFAALTMNRETGLTATEFGFGAGVLFFGYSFFEIPSNMALYRFGARRWIARIMITWGIVSAATAFVRGPESWYALRFLLGVAEAGFFPGITFYLATWFPAEYRARMLAWFLVAIPASTVIGGPISGLVLQMDGVGGLAGWQWLFILEGLPATVMGIAALRVLPDGPDEAMFLTIEERQLVRDRIASERRERETRNLLAALKDPRVLILTVAQFGFTAGSYGVGIWLPQIMKDARLSNVTHRLSQRRLLCGRLDRDDRVGRMGRSHRPEDQEPDARVPCRGNRTRLRNRLHEFLGVAALDYPGALRDHVGARHLLDDSDAVPHGTGRGRRPRVHQQASRRSAVSLVRTRWAG